jgi:hypothetical protein
MSSTTDLIIRRAAALLQSIDDRVEDYDQQMAAHKRREGPRPIVPPTLGDLHRELRALRAALDEHEGSGGHVPIPFESVIVSAPGGSDTRERHESYGLIGISRQTGGHGARHLFGSRVQYHPVTMCLRIKRAERAFSNDLSYDRFHSRELLAEIEMSAAQFADMVTNMNVGDGVPCSIRYVNGVEMEPVPEGHRAEQHLIVEKFTESMGAIREDAAPLIKQLDAVLAKRSIGKKDRETIAGLFERLLRKQSDSAPYTLGMFNESVDKLATEAKREVEAFMSSIVHSAGLDAIKGKAVDLMAIASRSEE